MAIFILVEDIKLCLLYTAVYLAAKSALRFEQ